MNAPKDPVFQKEYKWYTEQLAENNGNIEMLRGLAINLSKFISNWEQIEKQDKCPDHLRAHMADGLLPSVDPDRSWQRVRRQIHEDLEPMRALLEEYRPASAT